MLERPVVYKALRTVEKHMRGPLAVACLYEAYALTFRSRYTPPITVLANRHKILAAATGVVIGLHIWFYEG